MEGRLLNYTCTGLNATEIHNELTTAYEQGTVSYRTVAQWVNQLSSGGGL